MSAGVGFRLQQAGKRFNRDWIFRRLDLELHAGQQIALTGPNGSGKSTLLGVISAYHSLSEGSIRWTRAGQVTERDKVYSQLMLSAPYLELPEHLTAHELFDFHFGLKGCTFSGEYQELLDSAALLQVKHKLIRDYSSGMKQRLKLLLAFYSHIPLLLLDEPTANLDQAGISWYQKLKNEAGAGKSIVIASNLPYEYEGCGQVIDLNQFK